MLPIIFKVRLMTMAMAGWNAAAAPMPIPAQTFATIVAGNTAAPVPVDLYDENDHQKGLVAIWRDGSTSDETADELKRLFRCRKTHREHAIAKGTLAILASVADHYRGHTIQYVSAYRVQRGESRTSPHRAAKAVDFRVVGIRPSDVRDFMWSTYSGVGVGWYPEEQYVHIDTRPEKGEMSWTFRHGKNRYHPYWAELLRQPASEKRVHTVRPGS